MTHQLIVTILGTNRMGILSGIVNTVAEAGCNVLDSRQAVYGEDFSLTMILEGSQGSITKAELNLPITCNQLDLLSMMKRTKRHSKQNLMHLAEVKFIGLDGVGAISKVTSFFTQRQISVTAFRQNTFVDQDSQQEMMKCKMVVSLPQEDSIDEINQQFQNLLSTLDWSGSIIQIQ